MASYGHALSLCERIESMYYESTLSHHGILGQKWGVRRFQNKDGTRTAAGKKRLRSMADSVEDTKKSRREKKYQAQRAKALNARDAKTLKKYSKYLDDNELRNKINRLNMEQQIDQMASKNSLGKKFVGKVVDKSIEAVAVATVGLGVLYIKNKYGGNLGGAANDFVDLLRAPGVKGK